MRSSERTVPHLPEPPFIVRHSGYIIAALLAFVGLPLATALSVWLYDWLSVVAPARASSAWAFGCGAAFLIVLIPATYVVFLYSGRSLLKLIRHLDEFGESDAAQRVAVTYGRQLYWQHFKADRWFQQFVVRHRIHEQNEKLGKFVSRLQRSGPTPGP